MGWQKKPSAIVVDKAYGTNAIRQAIADEGTIAVIPSKSNARIRIPHDPDIYAQRNLDLTSTYTGYRRDTD